MNTSDRTTIIILGAGKGGRALLELFSHLPSVEVVGIADQNPSAPALDYANRLHIPISQDPLQLVRRPDINLDCECDGKSCHRPTRH